MNQIVTACIKKYVYVCVAVLYQITVLALSVWKTVRYRAGMM